MAKGDLTEMLRKFRGVPERLEQNAVAALKMAATHAEGEAKRKDTNAENHYQDRTGTLTNSIGSSDPMGSFSAGNLRAIISAGAPYALYVEKGTKPHKIRPRYRKRLRWAVQGGYAFAREVNHPGTKPTNFIKNATERAHKKLMNEILPDAIELSFVQAGFKRR